MHFTGLYLLVMIASVSIGVPLLSIGVGATSSKKRSSREIKTNKPLLKSDPAQLIRAEGHSKTNDLIRDRIHPSDCAVVFSWHVGNPNSDVRWGR